MGEEVAEVTKEVEFEDGTSYEVTHDGRVTETTNVYDKFFNALREDGYDVDESALSYCAYIDGNGGNIIGGSNTIEDLANEFGLTIEHVWFSYESESGDKPIHLAVEERDTCGIEVDDEPCAESDESAPDSASPRDAPPEQPFDEYLRENVLTSGSYHIDESDGIADVAEHDGGSGYLIHSDYRNVEEDDNVLILDDPTNGGGHFNGEWLVLEDNR